MQYSNTIYHKIMGLSVVYTVHVLIYYLTIPLNTISNNNYNHRDKPRNIVTLNGNKIRTDH